MAYLFDGLTVALVTPFKDGKIDYPALKKIITRCVNGGADALLSLGTTAETPSLTTKEKRELTEFTVENSQGKPVLLGCGSNCTGEAVRLAKGAKKSGAKGILSVVPYYNKPSISGIIEHFYSIADNSELPVILYDVPSRTGVKLTEQALEKLSSHPNVIGLKAAYSSREDFITAGEAAGESFKIYCGSDEFISLCINNGGVGVISAAANVIPRTIKKLTELCLNKKTDQADELSREISPLLSALYSYTNPIAIKHAASLLGLCNNELRLPMCPISHVNGQDNNKYIEELKKYD